MRKAITIIIVIIAIAFLTESFAKADFNYSHLRNLTPEARKIFNAFINDIEALGFTVVIRDSVRSEQQQQIYYDQDHRNAKAGTSKHEKRMAIDMDLYKDGKVYSKKTPKAIWNNTGVPALAKMYGITWGGNFKGYADNNHFQISMA